ncbi:MAG: sigma-54 dependent transcriptional regulator [Gemmatimonadaceae bacterium]
MQASKLSVLVVDDEPALREVLSLRMQDWGYAVTTAVDAADAERALKLGRPDVVLSDVVLPGISGVDLLRWLKRDDDTMPVIMMTAHGNIDTAVEAMKAGARDFLTKPLDYATLRGILDGIASERQQRELDHELDADLKGSASLGGLVGRSRSIRDLHGLIQLVASSDASVIITGESGTGKEVVAHAIHNLSNRRDKPFIALNAAAMPEGLIESELFGHEQGAFTGASRARPGAFELANTGTLFLDEIAEMPVGLQPKLLRILESKQARRLGGSREISFDVRVLAATNRPVSAAIRDGTLREDLYYRLNVFELTLAPLRERTEDIALLTRHFLREFIEKHSIPVEGVSDATQALLEAYSWPGNVRELRNVIERAVIVARSGWIEPRHLSPQFQSLKAGSASTIQLPVGTTLAEAERQLIMRTLERTGQNKAEAARQLGLDVKTIRNRLRGYGIEK